MNRSASIALLLIGILLFVGSCAPFGLVIYEEFAASAIDTRSLIDPEQSRRFDFQAEPGSLARFKLEAEVSTSSVQEDLEGANESYRARYHFPLRYRIFDSAHRLLLEENEEFAWQADDMSQSNLNTTSLGGTLVVSKRLQKLRVPDDGMLSIEVAIDADSRYQASIDSVKLQLYDKLLDNTLYLLLGGACLIIGLVVAVIGFVFLIVNAAREADADGSEQVCADKSTRQNAMVIHLSAFAGYVIPFGSLLIPLILWLSWRKDDAYLDSTGKEAVNFQLSMLIYYFVSLVLCLLLIGFLLLFAAMIFHLAYIIIAAIQTSHGREFRYPLSIRFFK